jgi:hypothetical protein
MTHTSAQNPPSNTLFVWTVVAVSEGMVQGVVRFDGINFVTSDYFIRKIVNSNGINRIAIGLMRYLFYYTHAIIMQARLCNHDEPMHCPSLRAARRSNPPAGTE